MSGRFAVIVVLVASFVLASCQDNRNSQPDRPASQPLVVDFKRPELSPQDEFWQARQSLPVSGLEKSILNRDFSEHVAGEIRNILKDKPAVSKFDVVKYAGSFLTLSYVSGSPTTNEKYTKWSSSDVYKTRLSRDSEYSISFLTGTCGWIDYSLGQILSQFPELSLKTRRVGFSNIPVQMNHSATEVNIDGGWVFYDASFGIYFEDKKGKKLSLRAARKLFPEVNIYMLQTYQGDLLQHGRPFPIKMLPLLGYRKISGTELFLNPIPNIYKFPSGNNWENSNILRTYFASDLDDQKKDAGVLRYSAEVSADGAGITTIVPINKKLVHQQEDVDDYTLLDLAVSSKGAGQLEMSRPVFFTITGNNLQNLLIDYNPVAVDRLSYRQSLINKQTNKQYGRLTFSTAFGSKGGSLVLRVINSRSDVTIDTISIELD